MPLTVQEILDDKAVHGGRTHGVGPADPVREAVAAMVREDIGSVVVRDDGRIVGILTLRELARGLQDLGPGLLEAPVSRVMDPAPATVHPEDPADGLRAMMTERHVSHAVVVKDGGLVGVVSFHDIARSAVKDVAFENRLLKQYIRNWPQSP
jgi:CBS domain-containing protein